MTTLITAAAVFVLFSLSASLLAVSYALYRLAKD